jgi:sporulation protein YlmC with PRC-barrel domain
MDAGLEIVGKSVVTVDKSRVGKVADFATEVDSMFIQKLYVTRSMIRSLAGNELGVDRTQIVEITPKQIIINNPLKGMPVRANAIA